MRNSYRKLECVGALYIELEPPIGKFACPTRPTRPQLKRSRRVGLTLYLCEFGNAWEAQRRGLDPFELD
jgi:hypothetical protein